MGRWTMTTDWMLAQRGSPGERTVSILPKG
jgi:hypothetical protein